MAQIYYYNADGSIKSSVKILKDGRALEVYPSAATAAGMKTWPSMEAWTQEMPREWRFVEAWAAATPASAAKGKKTVTVSPRLAYFLRLPEGATTSREAIRDALASYRAFYNWGTSVYLTKRDVKPDTPLHRLDDFLVTLTGLDPRGTFTARQIVNAVMARQTKAAKVVMGEEKPLNPEIVRLTAQNAELGWNYVRLMGENTRLKAEIEALQARLCTIRAAATFL